MIGKLALLVNNIVARTSEQANKATEQASDTVHAITQHASDTLHAVAGHAADAAHGAAAHGGGGHAPELPNWLEFAEILFPGPVTKFLWDWHVVIFSVLVWVLLSVFCMIAYKKRALVPGRLQNLIEFIVESLSNMVVGIIGEGGRRYVPFLGTLFVYIFVMNIFGLIPGMFSSTSKLNTTLALATCVFLYVQFEGIRCHYI